MFRTALVVGLFSLVSVPVVLAQSWTTTAYLSTATIEGHPPDEQERVRFVEALKRSLPDNKIIADQIAVVSEREAALVSLEVLTAEERDRVMSLRSKFEVLVSPAYHVQVKLTFGDYATEFVAHEAEESYRKTVNMGRFSTPETLGQAVTNLLRIKAATTISHQFREWATANATELRSAPTKPKP